MPTDSTLRVAAAVRQAMRTHGVTQNDLAAALNMSQQSISRRVNGVQTISVTELLSIASLLDVPVTDFLIEQRAAS